MTHLTKTPSHRYAIKCVFASLINRGLAVHRASIISGFTEGRTERLSELSEAEVLELGRLIEAKPKIPLSQVRARNSKTIIGLCYGVHALAPHLNLINEATNKPNYDIVLAHIRKRYPSRLTLSQLSLEEQTFIIKYFKILKTNYGHTN